MRPQATYAPPPSSFSNSIIQSAKRASGLIVGTNVDSLKDFLKSLVEESLPHRILYDDLYPSLKYDNWVLIVDGDPAKFKAARIQFQRVRIILCLYHATENIKKHFGHTCLTTNSEAEGTQSL